MKTKVEFLYEMDGSGEVFAYFPNTKFNDNDLRDCYSHIGQHSSCSIDYAENCKEAKYEDYSDLKSELENIGYKLEVLNKDFVRQDAIKKGKVWMVYYDHNKEDNLFEGTKTQCKDFIKRNNFSGYVKNGYVRLAQLIYESSAETV